MTKVIGFDLALNHMAAVELVNGELNRYWYLTKTVGSANRSKEHGTLLRLSKTKDKQQMQMNRLCDLKRFIDEQVLSSEPEYVGIEDYALKADQGAHFMGEIGGVARLSCLNRGFKIRMHDPQTVKMFGAHDGTCGKDAVERAVKSRWGLDFSQFNPPLSKPTKRNPTPKENRTTSEDLCDAFIVAKLVWTEICLRNGEIQLKDLHPKEIQVFNRVTKSYPVSLLERDWIYDEKKERKENKLSLNRKVYKR